MFRVLSDQGPEIKLLIHFLGEVDPPRLGLVGERHRLQEEGGQELSLRHLLKLRLGSAGQKIASTVAFEIS